MKPLGIAIGAAAIAALAVGCDAGPDEGVDDRALEERAEDVALPPSAAAPRTDQPDRGPDTIRPSPDTEPAEPAETPAPEGRRRSPEELDLGGIVNAYQRYYREEYVEQGSNVRSGVDPELVEDAKRRVALDWGYVDVGAWNDLLADMTRDQRTVLANRIAAANEQLAAELHGPGAPEVPGS
ncbi:MAG: hypothetical protein KY397_03105 [Gemmatimonadetes bacterium]|nr:hypothetical protein [Gemmatimonadota bacterium]